MEDRHPGPQQPLTLPPAYLPSQILIWNLDIGEPVKMIDCHTDVILCMSFNTDGSLLTTTCKDKKLRVIEPRSGRVLQVEPYVLLRRRRCWSLCRKRAVLGPCSCIAPMPLDQPIHSGPFSAFRNFDLLWAGRDQRTLFCHSDISSIGDSSAYCSGPLVPESLWLTRSHHGYRGRGLLTPCPATCTGCACSKWHMIPGPQMAPYGEVGGRLLPETQIEGTELFGNNQWLLLSSYYMATISLWRMKNRNGQDRGPRAT